ncbi:DUF2637 domain-containing protein [Streptomyces sp. NPDC048331]|uniref:DUF2637 domain-containing protein n=1 Tax=Streptomyces sp. NPDC048331 TaxID=3365534 RepID=UPI00372064B4
MTSPSPPYLDHSPLDRPPLQTVLPPAPRDARPHTSDTGSPTTHEQNAGPAAAAALHWSKGDRWLLRAGIASGVGVGTLGLASSYRALEKKAAAPASAGGWGWGDYAWMLPVGVDLGILTFSIVNLLLVKADKPLGWVKWVPRVLTIVTIVLNWQTGATLEGKIGHAALAALWVVLSEIAAHLYAAHIGRLKGRREMERIRLSRWFYTPVSTQRVNRLMKVWEITSYDEALERDREISVYRSGLRKEFGRLWRFKATEERLQPLRLTAYGMRIEEALEEPDRQLTKAELRDQKRELQQARARLQKVEAESQVKRAELHAQAAEVKAKGELEAAKAEAEAAASIRVQQAEADLQVNKAEADSEIKRVAAEAEAKVRELELAGQAREDELARNREKDQLSWETERARLVLDQQAEARRLELEARQSEVEGQLIESAETATARRVAKEEERAAAEAGREAAEALRVTAEEELKAKQTLLKAAQAEADAKELERKAAEDAAAANAARLKAAEDEVKAAALEAEARLNPVEREARQIADMIRAEGLKAVTLTRIEQHFGVSQGTASTRRKRAIQILQENGELPAEAA